MAKSIIYNEEARKALNKIQNNESKKTDPLKTIYEGLNKASVGSEFFEAYDPLIWEGKVKVDMLYFEQFLQKMEETENLTAVLGFYFKNIRQIYEFVNLKPEIYGKGITFELLEKSNEAQQQLLSSVIYEYFDKMFYSLTPEQRTSKYLEKSRELSKTLISEGVTPEGAIAYSTKVAIVEDLLTKIAFPFAVKSRIDYLIESDDYRKVFDQEALVDLADSFTRKVHNVAKIVAAVV